MAFDLDQLQESEVHRGNHRGIRREVAGMGMKLGAASVNYGFWSESILINCRPGIINWANGEGLLMGKN